MNATPEQLRRLDEERAKLTALIERTERSGLKDIVIVPDKKEQA